MPTDDGYISDYLIHWTGKKGDQSGEKFLSIIASTCELLLSYNRIHIIDLYHEIHEKMVCFTDVPLADSLQHCQRYGRFGIAFKKLKLMNVGAQPVFYVTHVWNRDMHTIFKFLQEQTENTTLEPDFFRALHRHFYFTQRLSDKGADEQDTYYLRLNRTKPSFQNSMRNADRTCACTTTARTSRPVSRVITTF